MGIFVGLYRGESLGDAELVAVSSDPELGELVAERILRRTYDDIGDPATDAIRRGRKQALEIIRRGGRNGN